MKTPNTPCPSVIPIDSPIIVAVSGSPELFVAKAAGVLQNPPASSTTNVRLQFSSFSTGRVLAGVAGRRDNRTNSAGNLSGVVGGRSPLNSAGATAAAAPACSPAATYDRSNNMASWLTRAKDVCGSNAIPGSSLAWSSNVVWISKEEEKHQKPGVNRWDSNAVWRSAQPL